jgi:hypothetical protein
MFTGMYTRDYKVKGIETYKLEINYCIEENQIKVIGCCLTRPNGHYYGYWGVDQWPRHLLFAVKREIRECLSNIEYDVAEEVAE